MQQIFARPFQRRLHFFSLSFPAMDWLNRTVNLLQSEVGAVLSSLTDEDEAMDPLAVKVGDAELQTVSRWFEQPANAQRLFMAYPRAELTEGKPKVVIGGRPPTRCLSYNLARKLCLVRRMTVFSLSLSGGEREDESCASRPNCSLTFPPVRSRPGAFGFPDAARGAYAGPLPRATAAAIRVVPSGA